MSVFNFIFNNSYRNIILFLKNDILLKLKKKFQGQCRLIGKPLYVLVEPRKADKCYKGTPPTTKSSNGNFIS